MAQTMQHSRSGSGRAHGLTRLTWCALVRIPDQRPAVDGPLARFRHNVITRAEQNFDREYAGTLLEVRAERDEYFAQRAGQSHPRPNPATAQPVPLA
jgi:hypothetical protein